MNPLTQLATAALLGTDRRPPDWPAHDGELGALLARVPKEPVEKALLLTAGVLGTCQVAGWLPAHHGDEPAAAGPETTPQDPRAELLGSILAEGPERLQAEAFRCVAAAGRHLPHHLLPKALQCGQRCVALRPGLLLVLGRRGAWLATQDEAWASIVGRGPREPGDDVWQHGDLERRRRHLTTLREVDAAQARALVQAALPTADAKERAAFVECLAAGLSPADEELLESTLADKSKEVRQIAARLLSILPESRCSQRMIARLSPLVAMEKRFLRGRVVTVDAPTAFDPTWRADLIEEARPKATTMGERAWWLFQLVRRTPLSWWQTHLDMTPVECLAWAQKSDWQEALMLGWAEAQSAQRRVDWAEAFLGTSLPPNGPLSAFDLLETLPPALREAPFLRIVANHDPTRVALSTLVDRFVKGLPLDAPLLSPETAIALVKALKNRIHSGAARHDWPLRNALVDLACLLPTAAFAELSDGWDFTTEVTQPFAQAVARIGIVLDQRRQLSPPPLPTRTPSR